MHAFNKQLTDLLDEAATYAHFFKVNEDEDRFEKIVLFAQKLIDKEYMIGYAGHFSAGKSSMINALTGGDLLPSSPIPTSANIVKVKKSETDYCVIHSTDGSAIQYSGHGFSDAIKTFGKDGASVSLIEIGHKESSLPKGITIMDTPGVDSTDDAHRLSTESALHLADLVFYTMDYNHVQSELNFRFTKELMRYNSNVYLIINQIDKHRETELSFSTFQRSVEDSFKMWGVVPKGIFYTSLKDPDFPNNDFSTVKSIVEKSINNWKEQFIANAFQTISKLRDEHIQFLTEEIDNLKNTYSETILEDEWDIQEQFIEEVEQSEQMIDLLGGDQFSLTFGKERNNLLKNAAITPYETRELLKLYLESLSTQFKVGMLFSAKKTAEEKARRKTAFSENISKLVHAQIEVHLKNLMKKSMKEAGISSDERSMAIDSLDMTIPFDEIEREFKVTTVLTGDTILNYSDQMKNAIQMSFRKRTDGWKDEMAQAATLMGSENIAALKEKVYVLKEKLQAIDQVEEIKQRLETMQKEDEEPSELVISGRNVLLEKWRQRKTIQMAEYQIEAEIPKPTIVDEIIAEEAHSGALLDSDHLVGKANRVAEIIGNIPDFKKTATYLKMKGARLENQEFTVALFGAFSAGKSSFSNALIGERILPVSPNPTTATINRIRPISAENENETADISLKTVDRMTEDVARSLEALGIYVNTLDQAFEKADEAIKMDLSDEALHIHKSFIAAFKQGYPIYKKALGTVLVTGREEFVKFVAEENRSCFVESIDFYYDCELTRKGITLVDTPGADSINARHTDVAFDYIRNADAILFVTYYNHAFARADREFLVQLGRVKDAFELDKMFFIVNAIDLATDEEEANAVKSFVANELQTFGIRQPRVHGISSLQALEAKIKNKKDPFMTTFEDEFHQFLKHDLKELAVLALKEETGNTTARLASLISRTESNLLRKSDRLDELNRLEGEIQERYSKSFAEVFLKGAVNELSELIYYILQRVFLRFGDFFKEAYNPSIFANHSQDQALKGALKETLEMLGFDLAQELKVTNLRMLNYMKKHLNERQLSEKALLKEKDHAFDLPPFEPLDAEMLSFVVPFSNPQTYSHVNKLFKNQRSFFEKGERDLLRDKLESLLKKDTEIYLGGQKERIEIWVNQWITSEAEKFRNHLLKESLNQLNSERTLLNHTESIEEWRTVYAKLEEEELV